jgi:hypothetical protein
MYNEKKNRKHKDIIFYGKTKIISNGIYSHHNLFLDFICHRVYNSKTTGARYDNVTLSPLRLQWGLRFGPIQRNGAAPGVIHTGRFFVLIPLKWLEKLTGVKDKYI